MARNMEREALDYHDGHRPGKVEIRPTKPCDTQRDLSLAYSPGVAAPCLEIAKNPQDVFRYTARGNLVAVITNGTAVLGLGNIGPLASKPVMEGKGVLFKKFADIDVFDIEVDASEVDAFCETVERLEPTFGGVNLEDIKAPECFHIEARLKKSMNIPVFHDDQHGTAIISTAAVLNGLEITNKQIEEIVVVVAAPAPRGSRAREMLVSAGVKRAHILMTDSKGVIYEGRGKGMNEWKERFAVSTDKRSLADALDGADVFLGLSQANTVSQDMLRKMNRDPIVLAMANPDPEITFENAHAAREDVIFGSGRSDYPNQVNNVLGFPFIFRGALDVRASGVNEDMKMAAARALAALAKEDVPESVRRAYGKSDIAFGREYLIPKPFDARVLTWVAPAVAKAACDSGVAAEPIRDWDGYRETLAGRISRGREAMRTVIQKARRKNARIVFPEAQEEKVLRACEILLQEGIARPVLVGDAARITQRIEEFGVDLEGAEIVDTHSGDRVQKYADELWKLRNRHGITPRDALYLAKQPLQFGYMSLRMGDADGIVCGLNRSYSETIRPALQLVGLMKGARRVCGMYLLALERRAIFFADATVNITPDAETLAEIAIAAGRAVRAHFSTEPRIAMLSFSNFGATDHPQSRMMKRAVELARDIDPTLVIDGEMQADTALVPEIARTAFPMSAIQGDANVLVFPDLQAGNIAYKLVQHLAGAAVIGPVLLGLQKPANVLNHYSSVDEIVNISAITALQARRPANHPGGGAR